MYSVYHLINNGKIIYIGSTNNPKKRAFGHNCPSSFLRKKYGVIGVINLIVVSTFVSKEDAYMAEEEYHNLCIKNGECVVGVNAGTRKGRSVIDSIRKKQTGKTYTEAAKKNMSIAKKKQASTEKMKCVLEENNKKKSIQIVDDKGFRYSSINECARRTGINVSTFRARVRYGLNPFSGKGNM